jgi:DNA-binding response OmpR family regulator
VSKNAPQRILIVDDEVAFLRIMREALAASLGCEIDTSPKPEYGFELALKEKYDLFIFDFLNADDRWRDAVFLDRQGLQ